MPRASKAAPVKKASSSRGAPSAARSSSARPAKSASTTRTAAKKAAPAARGRATAAGRKRATSAKTTKATSAAKTTKAAVGRTTKTAAPAARRPAAKTVTKKTAPSKPAVAPRPRTPTPVKRRGPLDKFLVEQRALLHEERVGHTRQAESLRAEAEQLAAEMEPGDIQFDEESGEGATMNVERERDLALSAQNRAAVDEIDRALAKIDIGTYGLCEQCGQPIPRPRLKALPYAALCVSCKSGGLSRR